MAAIADPRAWPYPRHIAHRGAGKLAPENTLAAFRHGAGFGYRMFEFDVKLSADGKPVLMHDATLDRTARGAAENCTGLVSTKTLAQIKTCDVGMWFNDANPTLARPEYVGLRIPTLEEVFVRYGRLVNYYIETKSPDTADRMEERLLALMAQHRLRGPARGWRVLIQSFSAASLPGSEKTSEPSFGRSRAPSGVRTSAPNSSTIAASPGVPGSTTSRAILSASISTAPYETSSRDTSLLPAPNPPVRPTFSMSGSLAPGCRLSDLALPLREEALERPAVR